MDNNLLEEVKKIIKAKLAANNVTVDDATIDMNIDECIYMIKDYCNIDTIPEALKYTFVNMCIDMVVLQDSGQAGGGVGTDGTTGAIKSIKQGDTTITFSEDGESSSSSGSSSNSDTSVKSIKNNYVRILNRYRRLRK